MISDFTTYPLTNAVNSEYSLRLNCKIEMSRTKSTGYFGSLGLFVKNQKLRDLFCKILENHHQNTSSLQSRWQSLNPVKKSAMEQDIMKNGALGLVFPRRQNLNHGGSERLLWLRISTNTRGRQRRRRGMRKWSCRGSGFS